MKLRHSFSHFQNKNIGNAIVIYYMLLLVEMQKVHTVCTPRQSE